jgi:hypothetical protein
VAGWVEGRPPGGRSQQLFCYGEQDSARPEILIAPCPSRSREIRPGGAGGGRTAMQCPAEERSPPRFRLPTPRDPFPSGTGGGGVPLNLWGAGRGPPAPLLSPERLRSVPPIQRRWPVSHNEPFGSRSEPGILTTREIHRPLVRRDPGGPGGVPLSVYASMRASAFLSPCLNRALQRRTDRDGLLACSLGPSAY